MVAIIGLLILYLVIQVLLLAVAAVIGFGLCWCLPDVNIGTGILIGLISSITSVYFALQLVKFGHMGMLEEYLKNQEDEDEDDTSPDVRLVLSPASKHRRQRSKKK